MDIERAVISKTLADVAFVQLIEQGIKETFFPTTEHALAFRWMTDYYQEYGTSPTAKAFKNNFPAYRLVKVKEPLQFCIDSLRTQRMYAHLDDAMYQATDLRRDGGSPEELLNLFATVLSTVHTDVIELRDTDLTLTNEERLRFYMELETMSDALMGIPTGFPTIDEATSGLQRQQLITVIGQPKIGKSTLLLRMAKAAHESNSAVLFIGFEMSNLEQRSRFDAMRSGVAQQRLAKGKLKTNERVLINESLKKPWDIDKPFVLSEDINSAITLSGLKAKIQHHTPDIVFVDGVYMMDDEQGEEKGTARQLTNLTRGLKRMAQQLDIPIVITTQVLTWKLGRGKNKQSLSADAIGYSSSFAQDSDLILGLDHGVSDTTRELKVILARNCERVDVMLQWDWDEGNFAEGAERKWNVDRESEMIDVQEDVG